MTTMKCPRCGNQCEHLKTTTRYSTTGYSDRCNTCGMWCCDYEPLYRLVSKEEALLDYAVYWFVNEHRCLFIRAPLSGRIYLPWLPFDFTRFKVVPHSVPPITTLPPEQLLAELAEEYVYAELCEEVMLSFAAENEARMEAMIAARSNVARKLDELVGSFRRLRQEEITGEIIELSAGSTSAAASVKRKRNRGAALSH